MAARVPKEVTRPRLIRQEEIRAKIQAGNLINRLEKHISGQNPLEVSQIKAIEILLDRSVAKLSHQVITGDSEAPVALRLSWAQSNNT